MRSESPGLRPIGSSESQTSGSRRSRGALPTAVCQPRREECGSLCAGSGGALEVWNDEANDSVTGPVEEFCLVVTQRINYRDTHLVIEGELAQKWMEVAQIFAGPPGPGRPARDDDFPIYRAAHDASAPSS